MSTTEISQIGQHPCCIHQTGSDSSGDQEVYAKLTRGDVNKNNLYCFLIMGIKKSNVLIVGFILTLTVVMGLWFSCSIDRCGF